MYKKAQLEVEQKLNSLDQEADISNDHAIKNKVSFDRYSDLSWNALADLQRYSQEESYEQCPFKSLEKKVGARSSDFQSFEDPKFICDQLTERQGARFNISTFDNRFHVIVDLDLLLEALGLVFNELACDFPPVEVNFQHTHSKGVLKFKFPYYINHLRKHQMLLNKVMRTFGGFLMEETNTLHLVFNVKSKYLNSRIA